MKGMKIGIYVNKSITTNEKYSILLSKIKDSEVTKINCITEFLGMEYDLILLPNYLKDEKYKELFHNFILPTTILKEGLILYYEVN